MLLMLTYLEVSFTNLSNYEPNFFNQGSNRKVKQNCGEPVDWKVVNFIRESRIMLVRKFRKRQLLLIHLYHLIRKPFILTLPLESWLSEFLEVPLKRWLNSLLKLNFLRHYSFHVFHECLIRFGFDWKIKFFIDFCRKTLVDLKLQKAPMFLIFFRLSNSNLSVSAVLIFPAHSQPISFILLLQVRLGSCRFCSVHQTPECRKYSKTAIRIH